MGLAQKLANKPPPVQVQQTVQQPTAVPPPPAYSLYPSAPPLSPGPEAFTTLITDKLTQCVNTNMLHNFYPQDRLNDVINKVCSVDWVSLSQKWNVNIELVTDLCQLALYDIAMLLDDSGSMQFCENGSRISDLEAVMYKVAEVVTMFDDDGILVRFINSDVEGNGIHNETEVINLVKSVKFNGRTQIGTYLRKKILEPFAYSGDMNKPILTIIVTDGEPACEHRDTLRQTIEDCVDRMAKTMYGPHAVSFQFVQVGTDASAQQFLDEIDSLSTIKGGIRVGSVVDVISYYEHEEQQFFRQGVTLTPDLYLLKLCLGSIDPTYDEMDE